MAGTSQQWQPRFGLSPGAVSALEAQLSALDHPPALLDALETLLTRAADAGIAPRWLNAPHAAQALVRLGYAAPFLLRNLTARPGTLAEGLLTGLDHPDPLRPWSAYATAEDTPRLEEADLLRRLRFWKYDSYTRLTARELLGLQSTEESCARISDLAGGMVRVAYAYAFTQAVARHGLPLRADGALAAGVVVGMGKLGGRELNYASDIDLIFIQDGDDTPCRLAVPPGQTPPVFPIPLEDGPESALEHDGGEYWTQWGALAAAAARHPEGKGSSGEFFNRMARQVIRLLSHTTSEGIGFRVDVDLRPQGRSGLLAPGLGYMEHYYLEQGREWERTAMLKARAIAGSPDLARRFQEMIRPFVFRRYLDYSALEGIAIVKHDINRFNRAAMVRNLKLGRGGIRENEFLVQALQLLYGGKKPRLQVTGHQEALQNLMSDGVLSAKDGQQALADYWLMRRVENRIQMVDEAQEQELPDDPDERLRVFHDFRPGFPQRLSMAEAELAQARQRTAERFDLLFAGMGEQGFPAPQEWRRAVRGHLEPEEQEAAIDRIDALFSRLMKTRMGERCVFKLARLLTQPELYRRGTEEAFPRWMAFFEQMGNRNALFTLIEAHPPTVPWVSHLFSEGGRHARVLIRHPEFMESFFSIAEQWESLEARFAALLETTWDDEEFILELQSVKGQSLIRILTAYLNREGEDVHQALLSDLADATVTACTRHAWRRVVERMGVPEGAEPDTVSGFAVLALGKLGNREMRFSSDLDLVFVYRNEGFTDKGRSHYAFYTRLTHTLSSLLTSQTMFGRLYELDHRLRPFGNKGLLVPSLSAFQSFLEPDSPAGAEVWNFQALTRIRPVCGDPVLAADVIASIAPAWQRRKRSCAEVAQQVRDMLGRLAQENAPPTHPGGPVLQLKYAVGGLVGFEFLKQAHFLCARLGGGPDWTAPPEHEMIEALKADYKTIGDLDERLSFYLDSSRHEISPEHFDRWAALSARWRFESVEALCKHMEENVETAFRTLAGG